MKKFNEAITKAVKEGITPTKEAKEFLEKNFYAFDLEIQNLLVDNNIIKKTRCEVWSRVMGYFRPISEWNTGKKQEFKERYKLNNENFPE